VSYDRASGRGCDIYEFVLATGQERKLRAISGTSTSEYLPTIDRAQIAFVRRYERRPAPSGLVPYLRLYNSKTRRTRALPGGTRGDYYDGNADLKGGPEWHGGPGPGNLDLSNGRLAVGWELQSEVCFGPFEDFVQTSEIWLVTTDSERTLVADSGCEERALLSPAISGSRVTYLRRGSSTQLARFDPADSSYAYSSGYDGALAAAGKGSATFHLRVASGRYEVVRAAPAFQRSTSAGP
jgi:hypothetical protein